jgi:catalase
VAGGTTPTGDIKLTLLLQEAFRHCKVLAAWGDGPRSWKQPASPPTP